VYGTLDGNAAPDSRWWYWIAAVPASAGLWFLSFLWAALATASEGVATGGDPVGVAFGLSLLVGGVPLFVVAVLFPVGVFFDSRALRAAGFEWPAPGRYALAAVGSLVVPPVAVAVATHYVYRRRKRAGVP